MKAHIIFFSLFLGSLFCVKAQTSGTIMQQSTEQLNYVFNPALELTISSGPGTFNFRNVNQYEDGVVKNEAVDIKSTIPWLLTVRSATSNFTKSANSNTPMLCSVLKIKTSISSTYQSLQTTDIVLATGPKGKNTVTGNSFNLNYMANLGFDYDEGDYGLDIIVTLTAQ